MAAVHLRNGRADRHPSTFGDGATWCGKKLLGKPEASDSGIDTFLVYGSEVRVTFDPGQGTCERCREAFDAAYFAVFPNGPEPLATFRTDNTEDMERAKAALSPEALNRFFGPGGGGMAAFEAALTSSPTPEAAGEGLRPMSEAPRDRTYILAKVEGATGNRENLNGRWFQIRHEGRTPSDFDLGWSLYPGFGGCHDSWFAGWMPLPDSAPSPSPVARVPDDLRGKIKDIINAHVDECNRLNGGAVVGALHPGPAADRILALFTASPSDGSGEGK